MAEPRVPRLELPFFVADGRGVPHPSRLSVARGWELSAQTSTLRSDYALRRFPPGLCCLGTTRRRCFLCTPTFPPSHPSLVPRLRVPVWTLSGGGEISRFWSNPYFVTLVLDI